MASAIIDAWITPCGPPDRILSDKGPQLMFYFFVPVMKMLGIETAHTMSFHPQSNGLIELSNRIMATQLR